MNIAKEVYVTYRRVACIDGFINEYDGVFVSERGAIVHLEETYGKDWYAPCSNAKVPDSPQRLTNKTPRKR